MAGSSKASVIAGLTANSLVTIAKFIGAGVSGSAALFSEAIHSAADTGNQALLLLGLKRAERPADALHPFGYGRDRFFWGLVSALGIFFVGSGVTLMHGIEGLIDPHPVHHGVVTWIVLTIALVLETLALVVAVRGVAKDAKAAGMDFWRYAKEGKDPTIIAVLLEDAAAVLGVVLASICIVLTTVTHNPVWDAIASLLVALILALVAIFLIAKNRAYLITKSIDGEVADEVKQVILDHDSVEEVSKFRGTVAALGSYRIQADVDFDGRKIAQTMLSNEDVAALRANVASDDAAFVAWAGTFAEGVIERLGDEIDAIEEKIQAAVPEAEHLDLEQD